MKYSETVNKQAGWYIMTEFSEKSSLKTQKWSSNMWKMLSDHCCNYVSVLMMSRVRVWVDLRLFTTQFIDKMLLDAFFKWLGIKEILRRIWLISANKIEKPIWIC